MSSGAGCCSRLHTEGDEASQAAGTDRCSSADTNCAAGLRAAGPLPRESIAKPPPAPPVDTHPYLEFGWTSLLYFHCTVRGSKFLYRTAQLTGTGNCYFRRRRWRRSKLFQVVWYWYRYTS